jgi:hypothetical protein
MRRGYRTRMLVPKPEPGPKPSTSPVTVKKKLVSNMSTPLPQATPAGQLTPGNIDIHTRPVVHNPDGSISTVRSITITDDHGRAILIPTVIHTSTGPRVVSNAEAIKHYQRTGYHLGIFKSEAQADAYALSLHEQQANEYLPKHP